MIHEPRYAEAQKARIKTIIANYYPDSFGFYVEILKMILEEPGEVAIQFMDEIDNKSIIDTIRSKKVTFRGSNFRAYDGLFYDCFFSQLEREFFLFWNASFLTKNENIELLEKSLEAIRQKTQMFLGMNHGSKQLIKNIMHKPDLCRQ